jgi:CBS domain-containing protein
VVLDDAIFGRDRDQLLALPVEKMMSRGAVTVSEETPVAEITDLMLRQNVRRVFVQRQGRLLGVITRNDIVRWLVSHLDP